MFRALGFRNISHYLTLQEISDKFKPIEQYKRINISWEYSPKLKEDLPDNNSCDNQSFSTRLFVRSICGLHFRTI
jgi:hypothetical protein